MPRLRNSKEDTVRKEFEGTIRKYMFLRNANMDKLAGAVGLSRTEMYKRVHDIYRMRIGELERIYDFLLVPKEERIINL